MLYHRNAQCSLFSAAKPYLYRRVHHQRSHRHIVGANQHSETIVRLFAQNGFVHNGLVDTISVGLKSMETEMKYKVSACESETEIDTR